MYHIIYIYVSWADFKKIEPMKPNQNQPKKLRILGVQLAPDWENGSTIAALYLGHPTSAQRSREAGGGCAGACRPHWFAHAHDNSGVTEVYEVSLVVLCPFFLESAGKQRPKKLRMLISNGWRLVRTISHDISYTAVFGARSSHAKNASGYEKAVVFHKFVVSWFTLRSVSRDRVN